MAIPETKNPLVSDLGRYSLPLMNLGRIRNRPKPTVCVLQAVLQRQSCCSDLRAPPPP